MTNRLLFLTLALVFLATGLSAQNYSRRTDIMLQGFNWDSHSNGSGWYNVVRWNAADIANAGFSMVWLPPPSDAAAPQGYLPRELYNLNTQYGNQNQLKSCINALHNRGVKVLADVVINHRVGSTNWADFQNPSWGCWAVTRNDEWGQNGGNPCGDWDTGDNYHAARDINHRDGRVRNSIRDWLRWLKRGQNAGFDGWRYDYVRGFNGSYVKTYNDLTNPYFSVGELWDNLNLNNVNAHRQQIVNWIDQAQGRTAAFDFTTKGVLQAAVNNQYWRLRINNAPPGVIGWWPSRAVTFVDNHDTGSSQNYWPFPGNKVLQGYAYILTHPGVPSVFWDHYFDWGIKNQIRTLMRVRKDNGLHSESNVWILEARSDLYAAIIDGKVAMKIGPGGWWPGNGWTLRISGNDFAVWDKTGRSADVTDTDDEKPGTYAPEQITSTGKLALTAAPNPAFGSTTLNFNLLTEERFDLRVSDLHGRTIEEIRDQAAGTPGLRSHRLDTSDLPAGIYLVRLRQGKSVETLRLVVR